MESLGSSACKIILSTDNFPSFFLKWVPVISFSCLITLARSFSIMLNRSDGLGILHTLTSSKLLIINNVILGLKWDGLPVSRVYYLLNSVVAHTHILVC